MATIPLNRPRLPSWGSPTEILNRGIRFVHSRRPQKIQMTDVILLHTVKGEQKDAIVTRGKLPLAAVRKEWGVRGFYVRYFPNWPFLFGCGIGLLFSIQTVLLNMFSGVALTISASILPAGLAIAIGFPGGWMLGKFLLRKIHRATPPLVYMGWAEWDPGKKENVLVPMDYELASQVTMNSEEQRAYLTAIGKAPPRKSGEKEGDGPSLGEIIPVYTSKGLYEALQAKVALKILSKPNNKERFAQMASIGGIAISMLIIAALVGITVLDEPSGSGTPPVAEQPSPGQSASNLK